MGSEPMNCKIKIRVEFSEEVPEEVKNKVLECLAINLQNYENIEVNDEPYQVGALVP